MNANSSPNALNALLTLPSIATALFDAAAALPHLETLAALLPGPTSTTSTSNAGANGDGARRPWETSAQGYTAWAVAQLLAKAREQQLNNAATMSTTGDAAAAQASAVAPSVLEVVGLLDDVRAVEAEAVVSAKARTEATMERDVGDESENMTMDTS